jgi:SAM-dependent methyltransferase
VPDRAGWIAERRRINEARMDSLFAPDYDERWGQINPAHRAMIMKLLDTCPPGPRILDAACGTGKYWPLLLDHGARITGVDQSGGMLRRASTKFPDIPVAKTGLQEMTFAAEFDGAICVDAMENVFPEHWPVVLARLAQAVRPGGPLYLTVELPAEDLAETFATALADGLPVVSGEYLKNGGYHYYPAQSFVENWIESAGLRIADKAAGDGYYHYLLMTRC